ARRGSRRLALTLPGAAPRAGLPMFLRGGAAVDAGAGKVAVQRKETGEADALRAPEDEELAQAKLRVNAPGDAFEQEADRVADAAARGSSVAAPQNAPPDAPAPSLTRATTGRSGTLRPPCEGEPLSG